MKKISKYHLQYNKSPGIMNDVFKYFNGTDNNFEQIVKKRK